MNPYLSTLYTATAGIIVSSVLQDVFGLWMLWLLVDCVIGDGFVGCIGLTGIPSVAVVLMLMFSRP